MRFDLETEGRQGLAERADPNEFEACGPFGSGIRHDGSAKPEPERLLEPTFELCNRADLSGQANLANDNRLRTDRTIEKTRGNRNRQAEITPWFANLCSPRSGGEDFPTPQVDAAATPEHC